jgi:hypothetical protein
MNPETETPLITAYAARDTARKAYAASSAALERAHHLADAAAERLRKAETSTANSESQRADELAAAIASGADEQRIPPIDSLVVDEVMRNHRQDAKLKAKALAKIEQDHAAAKAALSAAERAVINAVDELFCEEDIAAARAIAHHLDEAQRLGTALLCLAIAEEITGHNPLPEVTEALRRLDLPLLDRTSIALNVLKDGDTDAAAARAERREALIRGEESTEPEEKAA